MLESIEIRVLSKIRKAKRGSLFFAENFLSISNTKSVAKALRGIDYANHAPAKINPIPRKSVIDEWEKDYKAMQQSMLYNPSLPFEELILRITILKERVNNIQF